MSAKGYCAICRVSAGPAHYRTKSHADRLWHHDHPTAKRERKQRVRYAEMWAREAEAHVKVRRYRRSRPLDGVRKVVAVKEYWRELPPAHHTRRGPGRAS